MLSRVFVVFKGVEYLVVEIAVGEHFLYLVCLLKVSSRQSLLSSRYFFIFDPMDHLCQHLAVCGAYLCLSSTFRALFAPFFGTGSQSSFSLILLLCYGLIRGCGHRFPTFIREDSFICPVNDFLRIHLIKLIIVLKSGARVRLLEVREASHPELHRLKVFVPKSFLNLCLFRPFNEILL